jgi:hypothetical protein
MAALRAAIKPRNPLKVLQSSTFNGFLGSGLGAKRFKTLCICL